MNKTEIKKNILIFFLKTAKLAIQMLTLGLPTLIGVINRKIADLGGNPQMLKQRKGKTNGK